MVFKKPVRTNDTMKLLLFCFVSFSCFAGEINYSKPLGPNELEKIANKIYRIEGGRKTKYPYGIKSINTRGDAALARKICINTIKNNQIRWLREKSNKHFLDYLADKYCPPTADPIGNKNWKKNIRQ